MSPDNLETLLLARGLLPTPSPFENYLIGRHLGNKFLRNLLSFNEFVIKATEHVPN